MISAVCVLLAPLVIGQAIDNMAAAHMVNFANVTRALILLALIYLSSNFFLWLLSFLSNRIAYYTVNRLRKALFDKLVVLPLGFYDQNPHGDTASRFINDVDIVSDGLLQGGMALLQGIATIVGAVLFMLYLNPGMTLVVVLSAPASFLLPTLSPQNLSSFLGSRPNTWVSLTAMQKK